MTNSKGQSPCLVSSWLFTPCSAPSGTFSAAVRNFWCPHPVRSRFLRPTTTIGVSLRHALEHHRKRKSLPLQHCAVLNHRCVRDVSGWTRLHRAVRTCGFPPSWSWILELTLRRVDGFSIRKTARQFIYRSKPQAMHFQLHSISRISSRYPENIPSGTSIPAWAYLDVRVSYRSIVQRDLDLHIHSTGQQHL